MEIVRILAFLRASLPHENAEMTAHSISRNRERAIGVYPREGAVAARSAIGGFANSSHDFVRVTLLLRWGRDGGAASAKAAEIYRAVAERDFAHDGRRGFMAAVNAAPVWLGADERGIFEHVVDFDMYIEKEEKNGISGE